MSSMMCGMLLGAGVVSKKSYIDDVFSTYLWKGNGSTLTVNNGIDLSGEGGLTWIKQRQQGGNDQHFFYDTNRGATKRVLSNSTAAEGTTSTGLTQFNNNGFNLGVTHNESSGNETYASWTFRKAKGFFTIATWTGNSSYDQTISHDLGCEPGCIMYKSVSASGSWYVYHRGATKDKFLSLNSNGAAVSFSDTLTVTSTQFVAPGELGANTNGETYVAYLFAGGESTAATARSVDFDANTESLYATSSDYAFGTGDFTVEAWIKPSNVSGISYQNILDTRGSVGDSTTGFSFGFNANGQLYVYTNGFDITSTASTIANNQWHHIALVNNGGTIKAYVNGVEKGSFSNSKNFTNTTFRIANATSSSSQNFVGSISNVRVVKGTAVYTSSFRPPTEPLTNITNTKLLCCNNSSTTGSTVASGTLTADGSPTASTDSPFDDPAGFVFGDAGDQNVIKCGSYVGNGSSTGPEIFLGWEPSWILLKNASTGSTDWLLIDEMRGIAADSQKNLRPNKTDAEGLNEWLKVNPRGFQITNGLSSYVNTSGDTYIYVALRRSDGYVGKPPSLGTGVFAMDTGNSSSTIPNMDSNFPVDFALVRQPAATSNWWVYGRLIQGRYLVANGTNAGDVSAAGQFDSNVGFYQGSSYNSNYQSWMWERHAGFDVVTYSGTGSSQSLSHGLGKSVEMGWIKCRSNGSTNWSVWHKDIPDKYILVNTTGTAQSAGATRSVSSTHYEAFNWNDEGASGRTYIAMLFASVDGISKVGSYTGNGSATERTITLGFQPRFLILKNANGGNNWFVFDTVRGWASGNDTVLSINSDAAQYSGEDYGAPTSTGFTLTSSLANVNENNSTYIYYAHA